MSASEAVLKEIEQAQSILIIQGENPDGDSLASTLALEEILGDAGKQTYLYCAIDIPRHLRYMEGWARVSSELPSSFDLSIVVDTASETLLERTFTDAMLPILRSRPMIVIDHHDIDLSMPFATIDYIDHSAVSTGHVIYNLFKDTDYEVSAAAKELLTTSIMYDTRGLTTDIVTADVIRLVADFVDAGVSLAALEEKRQAMNRRDEDVAKYKGELLQRVEVNANSHLATVDVTYEEIEQYSDRYNPAVLVIDEMRLINGVEVAIAYKTYPDGKILAKIRTNRSAPIAAQLAERFEGGGHPHAAGFKLRGRDFGQVKQEVQEAVTELISEQS